MDAGRRGLRRKGLADAAPRQVARVDQASSFKGIGGGLSSFTVLRERFLDHPVERSRSGAPHVRDRGRGVPKDRRDHQGLARPIERPLRREHFVEHGGPNQKGGYQLDARITTPQEQALGALLNHGQIQTVPLPQLLDDLSSFQRVLFTTHRVRALADAVRNGTVPLPDPDPPLTPVEREGKAVFQRACAQCHGGPGNPRRRQHPTSPPGRSFDITASSASARGRSTPRSRRVSRWRPVRRNWLGMPEPTKLRCRFPRRAQPGSSRLGRRCAGRAPIRGALC